ncbi:hypothetical protein J6I75_09410 [Pseudidiomarina sp. 1APP75-27a]|uniref:tetratricopeptide repeat protein n=1 Tax=Pseudidiomarina terrestris TaxID=2820060 RepID=UPI002B056ED5|nr:tetratricopeptide repeat protein [Pseudidiomarina sp. 1APP75-27a]MEA3588570.1 hypothetical protein [Pseudidiomarina sp. 1APP75-27a]
MMYSRQFSLLTPILTLFLISCAVQAPQAPQVVQIEQQPQTQAPIVRPAFNASLFPAEIPVITVDQLFALTDAQKNDFLQDFEQGSAQSPAHERIAEYLHGITYGFNYKEQTYTASEALARNAGNCMALAIVTKALADLVDVDLRFQRVTNAPVYDRSANVVMVSDHVRARLYLPGLSGEPRSWVTIDYFPSRGSRNSGLIGTDEFLALYYRNRAAELMLDGKENSAFAYAQEALRYQPDASDTLNIIALLHRRAGDQATAEAIYAYVLAQDTTNLNVLYNYLELAKQQQREGLISELQAQIDALPDYNPYTWIALAERAYAEDDIDRAIAMYEKAASYAPYLHEVYWGQAKLYLELGRPLTAKRILREGLEEARRSATKKSFKAGWYSFENTRSRH